MEPGLIEVVAGVNLPMLIKLASVRVDDDMPAALDKATEAGRRYINIASKNTCRKMNNIVTVGPKKLDIVNLRGLHARASAKFVKLAETFDAEITVSKGEESVGGTSIMGLMMLAASMGCCIEVSAAGSEAEDAINALEQLVANKFDEDE